MNLNEMSFEELLKYCTDLNNSPNEKCLVCHIPINLDDKYIKLNCNHMFHPECIKYTLGSIKCLYCEKTSIPTIFNGEPKIKNIINPKVIHCKIVLKTGPNKGKFCDRIDCKYHLIKTQPIIQIDPISKKEIKPKKQNILTKIPKSNLCNHTLKSGPNSGKPCGRMLPCKYHQDKKVDKTNPDQISNKKINKKLNKNSNIPIQAIDNMDDVIIYNNDDEELIVV